jgi:hypothetical protein
LTLFPIEYLHKSKFLDEVRVGGKLEPENQFKTTAIDIIGNWETPRETKDE